MIKHISYSREAYGNPADLIDSAKAQLSGIKYDTMIGTGLSGSLVIPTLANALGVNWAIIRKDSESSHAGDVFEGTIGDNWIFVDDFMSTGTTFLTVARKVQDISRRWQEPTTLGGAYLYKFGGKYWSLPAIEDAIGPLGGRNIF